MCGAANGARRKAESERRRPPQTDAQRARLRSWSVMCSDTWPSLWLSLWGSGTHRAPRLQTHERAAAAAHWSVNRRCGIALLHRGAQRRLRVVTAPQNHRRLQPKPPAARIVSPRLDCEPRRTDSGGWPRKKSFATTRRALKPEGLLKSEREGPFGNHATLELLPEAI